MHVGTDEEKQALKELISILPTVIEEVKAKLPEINKTDAQLLGKFSVRLSPFYHIQPNKTHKKQPLHYFVIRSGGPYLDWFFAPASRWTGKLSGLVER